MDLKSKLEEYIAHNLLHQMKEEELLEWMQSFPFHLILECLPFCNAWTVYQMEKIGEQHLYYFWNTNETKQLLSTIWKKLVIQHFYFSNTTHFYATCSVSTNCDFRQLFFESVVTNVLSHIFQRFFHSKSSVLYSISDLLQTNCLSLCSRYLFSNAPLPTLFLVQDLLFHFSVFVHTFKVSRIVLVNKQFGVNLCDFFSQLSQLFFYEVCDETLPTVLLILLRHSVTLKQVSFQNLQSLHIKNVERLLCALTTLQTVLRDEEVTDVPYVAIKEEEIEEEETESIYDNLEWIGKKRIMQFDDQHRQWKRSKVLENSLQLALPLTVLTLSNIPFHTVEWVSQVWSPLMQSLSFLQILQLSHLQFETKSVLIALLQSIFYCETLQLQLLQFNEIDFHLFDDPLQHVKCSIQKLKFLYCDSFDSLLQMKIPNCNLLYLQDCYFKNQNQSAELLEHCLKCNLTIDELHIMDCEVLPQQMRLIIQKLNNRNLKQVEISREYLSEFSIDIRKLMLESTTLTEVTFENCFDDIDVSFIESILANKSIVKLNLSGNSIEKVALQMLLQHYEQFQTINLTHCKLSKIVLEESLEKLYNQLISAENKSTILINLDNNEASDMVRDWIQKIEHETQEKVRIHLFTSKSQTLQIELCGENEFV